MLRDMTLADVDDVVTIEQKLQHFPWSRENFNDAVSNGYLCYVDESPDMLRGYAILMPLIDEMELLNITVAKSQQRKGLGREMLKEMLRVASTLEMKRMFLEVRISNSAAISLYESVGFCTIGKRCNYYQSNNGSEDALVMACELTGGTNGQT
jgi:ribosomal-protein-alanine N-acetyltransferase